MDNSPYKKCSVIKCECGFEIPVLPDGQVVGKIIDAHIEEHKKIFATPQDAEKAAKRIHDQLLSMLFQKIYYET